MKKLILFCLLSAAFLACYQADKRDNKYPLDQSMYAEATPIILLKKDSPTLQEASGLAVSRNNPGNFWTHNDSGDSANLYLFDRSGKILLTAKLQEIEAFDWEEMSTQQSGSSSYLFIGDIGDNEAVRSNIVIHRIKEPTFQGQPVVSVAKDNIESMVIKYAKGARDSESFFYDPQTDMIVLISKREEDVKVYEFPFEPSKKPVEISSKGRIPLRNFTSADLLPNGDILIKNYDNIFYWKRIYMSAAEVMVNSKPVRIPYFKEPQGEAICTDEKGNFYTVSERSKHARQEVFFYERID